MQMMTTYRSADGFSPGSIHDVEVPPGSLGISLYAKPNSPSGCIIWGATDSPVLSPEVSSRLPLSVYTSLHILLTLLACVSTAQAIRLLTNGSELLAVNTTPTAGLTLPAIQQVLRMTAALPRTLRIALPQEHALADGGRRAADL